VLEERQALEKAFLPFLRSANKILAKFSQKRGVQEIGRWCTLRLITIESTYFDAGRKPRCDACKEFIMQLC